MANERLLQPEFRLHVYLEATPLWLVDYLLNNLGFLSNCYIHCMPQTENLCSFGFIFLRPKVIAYQQLNLDLGRNKQTRNRLTRSKLTKSPLTKRQLTKSLLTRNQSTRNQPTKNQLRKNQLRRNQLRRNQQIKNQVMAFSCKQNKTRTQLSQDGIFFCGNFFCELWKKMQKVSATW